MEVIFFFSFEVAWGGGVDDGRYLLGMDKERRKESLGIKSFYVVLSFFLGPRRLTGQCHCL